jgi:ABC-type lipoprotein export system ATPase subunit
MEIEKITILGGRMKDGSAESVERIDMKIGDVVSIVGPTGSGKTTLINDIELFANRNTPTGRSILINGEPPSPSYKDDPAHNPIALITQHTNFLSDLPVRKFLQTHISVRKSEISKEDDFVGATLDFGNQLTGEPINPDCRMTELSGGQTRALLIADATIICDTPIILLDEVENAGIHRTRALELLKKHRKIFIFVTHDPRIALLSDYRIIMRRGGIVDLLGTDDKERIFARTVSGLDDALSHLREIIRTGGRLGSQEMTNLNIILDEMKGVIL